MMLGSCQSNVHMVTTSRTALPNGLFHPKSCFQLERRPDIGIRCHWAEVGGWHLRGPKGLGPL